MKKLFTLLALLTLGLPDLPAQALSAEDRAAGLAYLEQTRAGVLAAAEGLSQAQLDFKPAPDKWSVAEVLEHIAASEVFLLGVVGDVMKAPPRPDDSENLKALDELVKQGIADRTTKVQAPEPLKPTNRFSTPAESLKRFAETRAKTLAFMQDTPDLRGHAADSPLGKKLDAYQWLLFLSAHSERHTKQMLEVKADPNFPKS